MDIQNMLNRPLVSIVMPMHNSEATVEETINSLINQSEHDFELLCVDDGSTDKTRDIVASLAEQDRRVQLIALTKSNAGHARNIGLHKAVGKYLMFLDSDDLFDQNMLRKLSSALREFDADIAICETDCFSASLAHKKPLLRFSGDFEEGVYDPSELCSRLFDGFGTVVWNKMFVREFIVRNDLSFQEQMVANDVSFTICALASAKSIALIPRPYVVYRVGSGTTLRDQAVRYPLGDINAVEETYRYVKEKCKLDGDVARNLKKALLRLGLVSLRFSAISPVTSKEDFRGVYERLRIDVAEWGLNHIFRGYLCGSRWGFGRIFRHIELALSYKGLMRCSPELLYWVYSVRSNNRWQTKRNRAYLLVRMVVAITLSRMFDKGRSK